MQSFLYKIIEPHPEEALNIQGMDLSDILKLQKKIFKSTTLKPIGKDISVAQTAIRRECTNLYYYHLSRYYYRYLKFFASSSVAIFGGGIIISIIISITEGGCCTCFVGRWTDQQQPQEEEDQPPTKEAAASPITDISPVKRCQKISDDWDMPAPRTTEVFGCGAPAREHPRRPGVTTFSS